MSLLDEISGFSKDKLKPTTTVERTLPIVDAEGTTGPDTALSGEAIKEFRDDEKTLNTKADELATMIKAAKHLVVYTGAGISTAAKIPDYRGPKGVWTLAARGEAPEMKITLEQALPTYSHMALVALAEKGILKYVVSTNVDGLHLRSGIPTSKLAELHGNIYLEHCMKCKKPYLRQFDVTTRAKKHITGRLCEETDCDGKLFDSIINFGELLPTAPLKSASDHSHRADLCLVIGTSMRVSPACDLPSYSYDGEAKGSLVIVNLQKTPFDKDSKLRIFSECDKLMKLVMNKLEIEVKEFKEEKEEDLATKMKGLKVDPAFKPLGATTNLSMADGGAPPSGLLSEVTGFNKDKLKKPTKPTTTDS